MDFNDINQHRQERNKQDWQWLLEHANGRRIVWELLRNCGTDRHSFVPADPHATAFHCGQQSIGLWIKNLVHTAKPTALLQMQQEYESELKSQERELKEMMDA